MKSKGNTGFRNGKLFCFNCGGDFDQKLPQPIDVAAKQMKNFITLHEDCLSVWKEPKPDLSKNIHDKAMWWIANGHVGMSSKTMWLCLMGQNIDRVSHPYDPDDFSRCWKLLEAVPEWKLELHKLKPLSKAWSNLVDNWSKLTEMYELNHKTQWKNSKQIGMYEFMEKLIR